MPAEFGKHCVARLSGEFEVEQHQGGERKGRPVLIATAPEKLVHRLLAVIHNPQGHAHP
jgi:hypothetical protein